MYRMTLLVAVLMIGVSGHVMGRDDTRHQFQDNTPTPHPFHSNFTRGFLNGVAFVAGVPLKCDAGFMNASEDFHVWSYEFSQIFRDGIHVDHLEKSMRAFGNGFIHVADAMEFCGLNTVSSNWTRVFQQIRHHPSEGLQLLVTSASKRLQAINVPYLVILIDQDLKRGLQYEAAYKIGIIIGTILTPNTPNMLLTPDSIHALHRHIALSHNLQLK